GSYNDGSGLETTSFLNKDNAKKILGEDYRNRETVTIPDGITSIGSNVFSGDITIKKLVIPSSVTKIEYGAFNVRGWTDESERIKDTNRFDLYYDGTVEQWCGIEFATLFVTYSGNNGLQSEERCGGYPLENALHFYTQDEENTKHFTDSDDYDTYERMNLVIPGSTTKINDYAFYRARCEINKIEIKDGVQSIGKNAFECVEADYVIIPGSVETIGEKAFYSSNLNYVEIGKGVKAIGKEAFSSCWLGWTCYDWENNRKVKTDTITIPGTIKSIGESAFSNNWNPKGKNGQNYIYNLVIEEGVESIEAYAFYNAGVEKVQLPSSLISIGESAFRRCFSLDHGLGQGKYYPEYEIVIPENVKTIGKEAFKECKSLGTITLPYSLETIAWRAFYDCVSLEKVLPEEWIGKHYTFVGVSPANWQQFFIKEYLQEGNEINLKKK
ncbi:MAG: leucine-rich repeat protein, partial [Treponema sp.]|nr:leucine-rich repeat protein [Treponema sp.]